MRLEELVKRKSVIFVGPSPILKGRKMGEFIDSFDVIVRTGASFNLEGIEEDYGSRTDILATNFPSIQNMVHELGSKNTLGIKMFCVKKANYNKLRINLPNLKIPVHVFKTKSRNPIGGSVLLTGNIMIRDLLASGVNKLHITGVDFYKSGNDKHLEEFLYYRDDNNDKILPEIDPVHVIENEIKYFKYYILRNKRVTIDEFLKNILLNK